MNTKDQKGISTFWGISIILIEAVVVFFVFFVLYFFWIENPTPTSRIFLVRALGKKEVSIPKQVDTAEWLTYSSNAYRFSLRYPFGYNFADDEIIYGSYPGREFSLSREGASGFSLRFFPVETEETVAEAFQRLSGVDPSIFQSFNEKVAGSEAIVYRRDLGQTPSDYIYFIGSGYLFESPFDEFSAQILVNFIFID